jgi:hypothetical protein
MDGVNRRLEREHNDRAWLAWTTVALDRSQRLPKLQSLMVRPRHRRQQSWQEQLALVRMINVTHGGS